jgi:thiol-disulfide isomerase/thioredoxin
MIFMKTNAWTIAFLTSLAMIVGCRNHKDIFNLSGRIENPTADIVVLYMDRNVLDTIKLNAEGSFQYEMPLDKPGLLRIVQGKEKLSFYGFPDKKLDIQLKSPDWEKSVTFAGDLALENEFMQEKIKLSRFQGDAIFDAFKKFPVNFLTLIDSISNLNFNLILKYEQKGMLADLVNQEKSDLDYAIYLDRANYPGHHAMFCPEDTTTLPSNWFDFVNSIDFNDEKLLDNQIAMSLIMQLIENFTMDVIGYNQNRTSKSLWFTTKVRIIDSLVKAGGMNEYLKYDAIKMYLSYPPEEQVYSLIDSYLAKARNVDQKKEIDETFKKWVGLSPGSIAPSWTLPKANGERISSSDFLGKYLYLDFWATWCVPCIEEIPYLKELVARYSSYNIEFISISIDQIEQKWKTWLESKETPWLQLHDNINLADKFAFHFIPAFVLIDPEGKIVQSSAPKPSSKDLASLLDRLLKKNQ